MIDIFINGESKVVDTSLSLADILIGNNFNCARVAVAVNSEFVARSEYGERIINPGDRLDVVAPVAGG